MERNLDADHHRDGLTVSFCRLKLPFLDFLDGLLIQPHPKRALYLRIVSSAVRAHNNR